MEWVLLAAVLVMIAVVTITLAVFALARYRLQRRHRINPSVPTNAPLMWMASPQATARLHRRLCRASAVARDAVERTTPRRKRGRKAAPTSPLAPLVADLEREALAVDEHLTLINRLGAQERRRLVAHLDGQVRQIEGVAGRIAMLGARAASPTERIDDPPAITELETRVTQLEAGRAELEALQRGTGVTTVPRLPEVGQQLRRSG